MRDEEAATITLATPSQADTAEHATRDARPTEPTQTLASRSGERYRLGAVIAKGGMGEILTASDDQIGREVAVKRMKAHAPSTSALDRFFREARIQGRLDHPAIVPVHELGVDAEGRPFFTMKKLAGTTLAAHIGNHTPRQRLLRAFAEICLAIEFAHSRGVVHRDLKPQNIVLGDFGEVYVLDWGVAKLLGEDHRDPGVGDLDSSEPTTVEGTVIGTPGYMAPEQARGAKQIDARTDVYALGCMLFEILTGERLHPHGKAGLRSVLEGCDARPSRRALDRDIPPELDALCVTATALDPAARIQTARELADRVERFLDGDRDLVLRQTLARAHLDAARAAFEAGDGEHERRTAMREAGRALALDPTLGGAPELVTRLMLEPPRVTPPAVLRLIEADNLETTHRQARAGAFGYVGFVALVPVVIAGGSQNLGYAAALVSLIALNCFLLLRERAYANLVVRSLQIAIGNAMLIALLARIASPVLFAPGVAAITAMALLLSPNYSRPRVAIALAATMLLAVMVPWLAELGGLISPTIAMTRDQLVLAPPALQLAEPMKLGVLVLYVICLLGAAARIAHTNRQDEHSARSRLHLQAWQLRQLVGD